MAKFKKVLAGVLAAAMVVTAAPFANLGTVQAATKATKGTSTLKLSATKATIKVGNKKTIKVTVNKKQAAALKVSLKSSNAKVAKVATKTTIKKGAKTASFKIVAKKKGSAKITVSYKTSANKTVKKTIKVTVKANTVALTGVSLSNNTPKVEDELSAVLAPAGATDVASYQWFTGATASLTDAISGATAATYKVTDAEKGKFVGVVVTTTAGKSFTAVSSVAVQEADAADLRILTAEQSAAKKVKVTFSNAVTKEDKITAKKGNNATTIESVEYASDFKSAELTMADRIVASEYTVILTPKDTKIKASEAKFTGAVSELQEIKFLNKFLVMKDAQYSKGFAYAKGFDQFGGEVNLSGLTVTPGAGKYESYDSETGKITIDDGVAVGQTSPFMTIKEVPVFIQYQQGTKMITAQETLTVSTQAYLESMEFGEIGKDGTAMRADKKLTVTELSSKKYYIEIKNAKDQYGNALSADDLQTQKDAPTLFVIPGESGAFYTTGDFGVIGTKTVLWLLPAADTKPGTMALTITGAGGKTFSQDVTIEDDPYIQTLTVSYPELYAGVSKSNKIEFSAVDQYGNAVDLWDFKPSQNNSAKYASAQNATGSHLNFGDQNHMSGNNTSIQISGKARFNAVTYDASKKSFAATIDTNTDGAAKGDIISFVVTSAGMAVQNASITVGAEGTAAKIKSSISGDRQLVKATASKNYEFDFNGKIQFEDANGNTMKRGDKDYPIYKDGVTGAVLTAPANFTPTAYYWTLIASKMTADGNISKIGTNGVYNVSQMGTDASKDIYAILWAEDGGNKVILDQRAFHFTQVVGKDVSYTATVKNAEKLYAPYPNDSNGWYNDSVSVVVTAKTDKGETYEVDPSRVSLGGLPFDTDANEIYSGSSLEGSGSKTGSVYVTMWNGTTLAGTGEASVEVNYTDAAPKAEKVDSWSKTTINGSDADSKYGTTVYGGTDAEFTTSSSTAATFDISDALLTIENANRYGDTYYFQIVDQYGNRVGNTVFKANGTTIYDGMTVVGSGDKTSVDFSAGNVAGKFYMTDGNAADIKASVVANSDAEVDTPQALAKALADAAADTGYNEIVVADNVIASAAIVVPYNDKLVVKAGKTLTTSATGNEIAGTAEISGTLSVGHNTDIKATGSVYVYDGGELDVTANTLTNNGTVTVASTATVTSSGTLDGTGTYEVADKTNLKSLAEGGSSYTVEVTGAIADALAMTTTAPIKLSAALTAANDITFGEKVTVATGGSIVSGAHNLVFSDDVAVQAGTVNISQAAVVANGKNVVIAPTATLTDFKIKTTGTPANTLVVKDTVSPTANAVTFTWKAATATAAVPATAIDAAGMTQDVTGGAVITLSADGTNVKYALSADTTP